VKDLLLDVMTVPTRWSSEDHDFRPVPGANPKIHDVVLRGA
jgi:hypothetical protein